MNDDTELEQAFRTGLRQAAERADIGVPLAARAHAGATTRRRRRWAVVGTVAAVVAVSGTAVALQDRSGADRSGGHTATQPSFAPTTDWRPESWHGLTVDVPADWGWGTAPTTMATDEPAILCGGPGASVRSDGSKVVNPKADTPWVGRPIALSDLCLGSPYPPPEAPYVWLGADVEPGTVDLGNGYTRETVEEFGTTLTVATRDPAVRRHVIDSARATTGCASRLEQPPGVTAMPTEGLRPVHAAGVCAYKRGGGGYDLVYASSLDADAAQRLYSHGIGRGQADCPGAADEYVTITFSGTDGMGTAELTQDWVVDPGCGAVSTGTGTWLPLTDAGMAAWSKNGAQAVLFAFIGMLG